VTPRGDRPSVAGVRERAGTALLRTATDMARQRRVVVDGIAAEPAGTPGRDQALACLAPAAWLESAFLWLAWRLLPGDALSRRMFASGP
jgi:hypothetical protein